MPQKCIHMKVRDMHGQPVAEEVRGEAISGGNFWGGELFHILMWGLWHGSTQLSKLIKLPP